MKRLLSAAWLIVTLMVYSLPAQTVREQIRLPQLGKSSVKIGASFTRIKQSDKLELKKERLVERVNKVLAPLVKIDELKSKHQN